MLQVSLRGIFDSGKLQWEKHYINGKAQGTAKQYYESGALSFEIPYVNDKEHGKEIQYSESGVVIGRANYKDGILIGFKICTDGRKGNELLNCAE